MFQKDKTQSNQNATIDFNGLILKKIETFGDIFFVKGNNFDKFRRFRENIDQYSSTVTDYVKTINARDIEGIFLNSSEAEDSHYFWTRGNEYPTDSETYFMEIASHIPEVSMRLKRGESLDSIRNISKLETCCDYYFDTPIRVYEVDGFYQFGDAGRHRCMAAQKLGYAIPVNVVKKYESNHSLSQSENYAPIFKRVKSTSSVVDDLNKTNPNFSHMYFDSPWNINCQRCVSAYEARRRGYDVEALPVPSGNDYLPFMNHPDGWPSVYENFELINCSANSGTAAGNLVEEQLESWGDNCRAIVRVRWKPECGGGGHVFIAERINGKTMFVDPQNGEVNAKNYFELAKGNDVYCMRIDNLEFSEKINQCCKNRKEEN